ncbi:TadE/TadG family type IV pilus assembly protein [Leucobacter luti]|uniref:TadE/TadG family type IV pilus assembly protein n=1 Tax=Leucobacter luti TaxID=340320 RepID=UPI003D07FDE2
MLPAVVAVLGLMIGGISIAAQRVTLSSLAGELVRLEARGDAGAAERLLRERPGQVQVERRHDGPLLCATLSESPGRGILGAISISVTACAAEARHRAAAS